MKKNKRGKTVKYEFITIISLLLISTAVLFLFTKPAHSPDTADDTIPEETDSKEYPLVIIDAGHGGEDGGAIGINGAFEKDINLAVAKKLEQMLNSEGVQTRLTRTDDRLLYDPQADYQGRKKILDMQTRLSVANEYTNAIFISVHMNSFSSSKYSGLQVYFSKNSPLSQSLAQTIQSTVKQKLQPDNNRAIKPSDGNILLLEKIMLPCVLVECGFVSNPEECLLLCSEEYQNRLCMILYDSIINYFDTYCDNPVDIS